MNNISLNLNKNTEGIIMDNELIENVDTGTTEETPAEKTYSEAELNSLIDRRVTQAVNTVSKKYEKKMAQQKELIGLDENARAMKELENRLAEAEAKNREYALLGEKNAIMTVLSNRGLSTELVDYLNLTDDNEQNLANIDKFEGIIKAIVDRKVNERISGSVPKTQTNKNTVMTKEWYDSLSLAEKQEQYSKNPSAIQKLLGY